MPPRFVYWTIIFGGQPTSFRSATRDELMPTFKQIQAKHPDAQLRYFARGKLWFSEEEAQAALVRERFERRDRPRPSGPRPRPGDRKPPGEGRPPQSDGSKPRDEGRPPQGGGWKPRGEGRPPQNDGEKPRGEGRPPQSGGWKPRGE